VIDPNSKFDAVEKENALRAESESWDTTRVVSARPDDIPVIDVREYLASGSDFALETAAQKLGEASRNAGFFSLTGHSVPDAIISDAFEQTRRFHRLPLESKNALLMDQPGLAIKGAGYMPIKNRKLPHRASGNENEAFIVKRDRNISLAENLWPDERQLPGFRGGVEEYAARLEALARKLLPIYARALEMGKDFFTPAFTDPFLRLRMTHYPAISRNSADQFGIAPHVDTTFFTLLVQDSPGLCVFSERRRCWISVPMIEAAIIVNTGELLKHWSNDEFVSVKHFANNNVSNASRYSIPFFFNANTDYRMKCIPSCCGPDRPARYAEISYAESQGVVQGE
jgi:isopenicillin N synthase-like dioxygenase